MKSLYCPQCNEYLEGGSGDLVDCHCGWTQPADIEEPETIDINEEFRQKVLKLLNHIEDVSDDATWEAIDIDLWNDVTCFKHQ